MIRASTALKTLLPLGTALALSACGGNEEKNYEADATDVSGGELIANPEDPNAVPVDTPDTPMTPVPEDSMEETPATDAPAE